MKQIEVLPVLFGIAVKIYTLAQVKALDDDLNLAVPLETANMHLFATCRTVYNDERQLKRDADYIRAAIKGAYESGEAALGAEPGDESLAGKLCAALCESARLIEAIEGKLTGYSAEAREKPYGVNYGQIGDVSHVNERLEEIAGFLGE